MIDLTFANPKAVHLIWLWLVACLFWAKWQISVPKRFKAFSPSMQSRLLVVVSRRRRWYQLLSLMVMFFCATLAFMRPQASGVDHQSAVSSNSGDIVVALDLSKSMLAEDAAPNRLSRAKSEIREMIDELDAHRVGLVGFAGKASVLCPLTTDRGFFHLTLQNADPSSISKGGTRLGDALRTAVKAFGPGQSSKIILLVTDGEDHESYPLDEAIKANERGIVVVTVGFGSESGSQITLTDPETGEKKSLKDQQGQSVISKLDGETLRDIATKTDGVYVPAGTAALDLESIVSEHIKPIARNVETKSHKVVPRELYLPFVLVAFLSFTCAIWLGGLRRQETT